jgi:DNA-binding response OmpR family regulator
MQKNKNDTQAPNGSLMLVSGSPDDDKSLVPVLEEGGYNVILVAEARKAEYVGDMKPKGWVPTIVLVDLTLPDMSGYELVRRLSDKYYQKSMILMMSRHSCPEDVLEATSAGAVGMLKKPVTLAGVNELVEKERMRRLKSQAGEAAFIINNS